MKSCLWEILSAKKLTMATQNMETVKTAVTEYNKEDINAKLEQLKQERLAKQQARLEKLKAINLQKASCGLDIPFKAPTVKPQLANPPNFQRKIHSAPTSNANMDSKISRKSMIHSARSKIDTGLATNGIKKTSSIPSVTQKPAPSNLEHDAKRTSMAPPKNSRLTLSSMHRNKMPIKTRPNHVNDIIHPRNVSNNNASLVKHGESKFGIKNVNSSVPLKKNTSLPVANSHGITKIKSEPVKDVTNEPGKRISVFDRLSKPKHVVPKIMGKPKPQIEENKRPIMVHESKRKEPEKPIVIKRSCYTPKLRPKSKEIRRSISSVHIKRLGPNEMAKCIHRSSSVDEALNMQHIEEVNEDESVNKKDIVLTVKEDRKKSVTFMTPMRSGGMANSFVHTPKNSDLRMKLSDWLHRKGKSLDSYHHLQCFGVYHLAPPARSVSTNFVPVDEDNKENEIVSNDNNGTLNNGNENAGKHLDVPNDQMWRRASYLINDTLSTIDDFRDNTLKGSPLVECMTPSDDVEDLMMGALNDLYKLVQEGYEWEQCARWLRVIRERFPEVMETSTYWEVRATLEQQQGNYSRTFECLEKAVIRGTPRATVEASLDQLLDKFMKLKLSPNSCARSDVINPKLVDVKNAFKSSIIRLAVQQKNLRDAEANGNITKFIATPVRRSSRLSTRIPAPTHETKLLADTDTAVTPEKNLKQNLTPFRSSGHKTGKRTPLIQICSSLRQIEEGIRDQITIVPNKALKFSDSP